MTLEIDVKYRVHLHQSDEGFDVWVPALPGCCSQGQTEDEALVNIADAIREYLESIDESVEGELVREVDVAV